MDKNLKDLGLFNQGIRWAETLTGCLKFYMNLTELQLDPEKTSAIIFQVVYWDFTNTYGNIFFCFFLWPILRSNLPKKVVWE